VSTTDAAATATLAAFAAGLRWEQLPREVVERANALVADALANAIAAQPLDSTASLIAGLRVAGVASGDARVAGSDGAWSPYAAAMITGAAIHSLDFDDTHASAMIHPGAPIIAAALAAAQITGAATRELVTGIVAGYEVMTRVSRALQPQDHADRGFHLSATTGIFGAAAAAGRILGLDARELEHAFGTALSRAAGSGQFLENGAWTKRFHIGAAAADGLMAAVLAREGFTGAARAIEGPRGFLRLYASEPRVERATAGLGSDWEILRTAIKPYPCCRAIHAPLDALFALTARAGTPAVDEIASVRVGMPRACRDITGIPAERKRDPQNVVDCQFSAHLCIAAGLVNGRVAFDDYPSALADPTVRALMQRIEVEVDPEADAEYPETFPGRITIRLHDGSEQTEYVRVPQGEPDNMLTADQFRVKFLGLTVGVIGGTAAQELHDAAIRLADDLPTSMLLSLAVPARLAEAV
jgi:2-methylcitrate dehydratase PrpD